MTELPKANTELMVHLLNAAESGPLMHWFVMMALEDFAERVITAGPTGLDNPLVGPADLLACAHEAMEIMEDWQL